MVAERQGQTAALNMLGGREKFNAVPFFWSQHYDVPINYVGHAERWDEIAIEGDIAAKDCLVRYKRDGRVLAVASIYRDLESLRPKSPWSVARVSRTPRSPAWGGFRETGGQGDPDAPAPRSMTRSHPRWAKRRNRWANRDLNVGAIVWLARDLSPFTDRYECSQRPPSGLTCPAPSEVNSRTRANRRLLSITPSDRMYLGRISEYIRQNFVVPSLQHVQTMGREKS